ncbi:hypothetical protein ABT115_26545 [Streptomyces sp. NPDC001832]|uniref:hypothetical protein n=1 Tax=Streptomyces sp. NPDC001832 TaxID=3154527 RepID=UPI00332C9AF8
MIMKSDSPRGDDEWFKEINEREKNVIRFGWTAISAVAGLVGIAVVALVAVILIAAVVMMYIVVAMG